MNLSREQIRAEALKLNPAEREALAEELLLSINGSDREAIDAAWLLEVRRRDAAFISGQSRANPIDSVTDRLKIKSQTFGRSSSH
jgi:hypothetical protein